MHTNHTHLTLACLFDSGALQGNYISADVAAHMEEKGEVVIDDGADGLTIVFAGTSNYTSSLGSLVFHVTFLNEVSHKKETLFNIKATILDSQFQLIIGLPLIRQHDITAKIPSFFSPHRKVTDVTLLTPAIIPPARTHTVSALTALDSSESAWERWRQQAGKPRQSPAARNQLCLLCDIKSKDELLFNCDRDIDQVDWPDDPFDAEIFFPEDSSPIEKITIEGPLHTQIKIRELCKQYEDIFSEHVRTEPASVPPMEIKVIPEQWKVPRNRGPPRLQSTTKMAEIEKQINKYLALGVIKPVDAAEYSNIHMVPKPTPGEWRFCLDFVQLNRCTEGTDGWPIPNIPAMLMRIGNRKSTVFGVMDMTAGYHQAPISAASQLFTAFICFMGIFCWLRVPMGLKNAASYFQRVMATVVLASILYIACELYIDDIFVFGKDDDEFVRNLESVFKRLRMHKVTLNPKKCRFGLTSVEYVGHIISADGVSFSKEKREKVLNFPLPQTQKQLQAFLGLVNYFRDHVPQMTEHERPLRDLMDTSKKNFTLVWNTHAEQHFYEAQEMISNCPKLFFVDGNATIVVMTDASDYGVGAYIYQLIDGKEYPIVFFSKALHGAELNWATIEKEAFAIFLTLTKFHHLLRDTKFLLRTDHKNLTYINAGGSQKIRRWGIAVQDFDFDIEHVPGKDNFVADAFSRLCINNTPLKRRVETLSAVPEVFPNRIPDEHYAKISAVHNSQVGHFGVEKTLQLLVAKGQTWVKMRRQTRQFIQQCPLCQKLREGLRAVKTHPFVTASYTPMDVLNIDTIGPLDEDADGNKYILVIIDCFTRWVELFAIPDTSAKAAAKSLIQHVGRYGSPAIIRSDRGSQFVNGIIAEFSALTHTEHQVTMAYSKEENAIVERANKEVLRHLRAIIFHQKTQQNWGFDQLPLVMRILNSEEKKNIGVSPAEILFGNAVDLGRHILHQPVAPPAGSTTTLSDYMSKMLAQQASLIEVAQETQMKHDTHHLSSFDSDFTEYPINSYVLFNPPAGDRPKLQTRKKGPFQVVNFVGSKYVLQDLLTGKNFDTHISNLSPFNFDATRTDPTTVAQHDEQEFLIEAILDHRGDRTRRSTMEFLVRWEGFAASYDSWEPYANLRDTAKLSEYLANNRLRSLIPRDKP